MAITKKTKDKCWWGSRENVEKSTKDVALYTVCANVNLHNHYGKQYWDASKN